VQALANDVQDFASMARAIATMNRAGIIVGSWTNFNISLLRSSPHSTLFLQAEVDVLRD
jgi:hypothetical protein